MRGADISEKGTVFMNVAVCDDQQIILDEVRMQLEKMSQVEKISLFSDIDEFLKNLQLGEFYHVVLMDIVWKRKENGIDFASKLKEITPMTKIIYITGYGVEFVEDIFLRPANLSGYLMKPIKYEALLKNIEKIEKEFESKEKQLVLRYRGVISAIAFSDILYIENQLHRVSVVSEQKTYYSNENLERVKQRLNDQFLFCHKSYVVNMNEILEFKSNGIVLSTGVWIPVSKARYKEAKEKYCYYVGEQMH